MPFELPCAEDLDAVEQSALDWPEETLSDDAHDGAHWRMSGWLADAAAHAGLRDSPVLGFYDDQVAADADDAAPSPAADERILRAMASCPDLRDSVRGDPRRAREAWHEERAIRDMLEAEDQARRRARDGLRHQSDPCAPPAYPPPPPPMFASSPAPSRPASRVMSRPASRVMSRPASRVMSRAASQEWRHALYLGEEATVLEHGLGADADPRSLTPTPAALPVLRPHPADDVPRPDSLATINVHSLLVAAELVEPASPVTPVRLRPPPISVPDRGSVATVTSCLRDSVLGAFPVPPTSTPTSPLCSVPASPVVSTRTRSESAGSRISALPTPALTWSSPSINESRFEDSDDDEAELAPPVVPFMKRKARWSLGAGRASASSSVDVRPPVPKPEPKPARAGPNLFERTARRLSIAPKEGGVAFPLQRSPSTKSRRTSGTSHILRHSPSHSSFLDADPFASVSRASGSTLSPPMSPVGPTPKRKIAVSFSNFSLRAALDSLRKPAKSPLASPSQPDRAPAPAAAPAPAPVSIPTSPVDKPAGPTVEHVLIVSGLPLSATTENETMKQIASFLSRTLIHHPAKKIRRRSNGLLHIYFVAPITADVTATPLPPRVQLPQLGTVLVSWMPDSQLHSPLLAAPMLALPVAVPGIAVALR